MSLATNLFRSFSDATLGPRGVLFIFHRMARKDIWSQLLNNGFYLNETFLDEFLSYLAAQGWDFVSIEEAVRRSRSGDFSRKFVNFSLDDCYRDTYELVIPLFRRHKVPVTLYLTTGIPDNTLPLWSAGLEETLMTRDRVETENGPLVLTDYASRVAAYQALFAAWDDNDAGGHYTRFCELNGIDEDAIHWKHAITWEMLDAVKHDPCVEIGGHTISHPHIANLDRDRAAHEIGGCLARIEEKLGIPARHFAFPYGRAKDCGPREFALAEELGLGSAATTVKGLVYAGQDPMRLPRITLNGKHQNLAMMEAHLSGLTALAGSLKGCTVNPRAPRLTGIFFPCD